jgi:hypothetical protein
MINRLQAYLPAEAAEESAEESQRTAAGMKGKLQQYLHWAQRQIAEHPKVALGVGVALGVTLGWLSKRR